MAKRVTSIEMKQLYPEKRNQCVGHLSKYAIKDKGLSWAEYGVLTYLNTFTMGKNECYLSRDKILGDLGISRYIYDRAMRVLRDNGYVTTGRCIRNKHLVYAFFMHEPDSAKSLPSKVKERDPEQPKYIGLDRFGYGQVSQDLVRSPALPFGSKCLYAYLKARMGQSMQVKLTMEQIKREMDLSETTINKYMAELVRYDLIDKQKMRKAGKFDSVLYYVPGTVLASSPSATVEILPSPCHKKTTTKNSTTAKLAEHNKTKIPLFEDKHPPSSAGQTQSVKEKERLTDAKQTNENPYSYDALYQSEKAEIKKCIIKYGFSLGTAIPDSDIEETIRTKIACIVAKHNKIPDEIAHDGRVLRLAFQSLTGYQQLASQVDQLRYEMALNIEDALVAMCCDKSLRKYANGSYVTGMQALRALNDKIWASDTTPIMFFRGLLDHVYAKTNNKVITSLTAYLRSCIWCYLHEYKVVALTRNNAEQYLRGALAGEYNELGEAPSLNESDSKALDWLNSFLNGDEQEDDEIMRQA